MKLPAFQFYPGDWLKDTRHLSPAAKGAWIDLMVGMWDAQIRGVLCLTMQGYARMIGSTVEQAVTLIDELTAPESLVCDRDNLPDGRVRLKCRRMVRDEVARAQDRDRQQRHRGKNQTSDDGLSRDCHGDVTDESQPSSASSASSTSPSGKEPAAQASAETAHAAQAAAAEAAMDPVVLEFPVDGQGGTAGGKWPLRQSLVTELAGLYPSLDVMAEMRAALGHVLAKPVNRKTASGMRAYLTNWLRRSQNSPSMRAKPAAGVVATGSAPRATVVDRTRQMLEAT